MRRVVLLLSLLVLLLGTSSCAALRSFAALSRVDFSLDRVHQVRLAGVELDGVRGYGDVTGRDVLLLGLALAEGGLPLEVTLRLGADNPADNPEARMVGMDWTLFIDDRETVSGGLGQEEIRMPPGEVTPVPVRARLDLLEFFDGGLEDLVNLATSLAGVGGEPANVRMEVLPTVETPLGPIRYPRPLVLGGS